MQQGTNRHSSSWKQAVETRILRLRTSQMHYSGLSSNFRSVPTHLGSLEPIIYIIENDTTRRGTEFRSIPISITCCCCVSKLTNEAFTFPPNPDVGSLFLYWDRGGAHSQIAPLCPEAMAMAQLSGIWTACILRDTLAGLNRCVQRWVGVHSEWWGQ